MSRPDVFDFDVYIGDSWPSGMPGAEFLVSVTYQGGPVNLTPALEIKAEVRRAKDDPAPIISFGVDIKDQGTSPGQLGLTLGADDTALLEPRQYYWDLQVNWSATENVTPLAGLITAIGDVTR